MLYYTFNGLLRDGEFVDTSYYDTTPNAMTISVESSGNHLFISDKFTLYPGWTAYVGDEETEIHLTNGVLSSVYVPEGSHTVHFEYAPQSFKKGKFITFSMLFLLIIYGCYLARKW